MPGVVVNTGVRVGPAGTDTAPSSTYFIAGEAERGPLTEAKLVRSMVEFEKWYGEYSSVGILHQHVQAFFEEGGTRCQVLRLGTSGTAANDSLVDGSDPGVAAVVLTAANAGEWGNQIDWEIIAGTINTSARRLVITYDGTEVFRSGELTSNSAMVSAVNAAIPHLVVATAGTAADNSLPVADTGSLTSGAEPTAADDAGAITAINSYFGAELGAGAIALPGRASTTVYDGLRLHAQTNHRIALCSFDETASSTDAATAAAAEGGANDGEKESASYLAFYWPWVKVPDGLGATRNISPESFVAAARCRAHLEAGPWRAGAGLISSARFVTGLVANVTKATGDTLDASRVNAIRVVDGVVRVYGARSASADEENWRFITYRDVVNYVITEAETALEDYVFSVIDGRKTIFAKVASELVSILEPIRDAGGLFERLDDNGRPIDRGYSVDVSNALNPVADLASGVVRANVGIRVSSIADLINVTITKSGLTTAV